MDMLWFKARRVISVLLVFAMLASLTPVQAFAVEDDSTDIATVSDTMPEETTEPSDDEQTSAASTTADNEQTEEGTQDENVVLEEDSTEAVETPEVDAASVETPAEEEKAAPAETPAEEEESASSEDQAASAASSEAVASSETNEEPAASSEATTNEEPASDPASTDAAQANGVLSLDGADASAEDDAAAMEERTVPGQAGNATANVTAVLPEGVTVQMSALDKYSLDDDTMQALMDAVGSADIADIEAYDISLADDEGNAYTLPEGQTATVTLSGVALTAGENQERYAVHVKADGSVDMGNFADNGDVTFENISSFSPFVVVTVGTDAADKAAMLANLSEQYYPGQTIEITTGSSYNRESYRWLMDGDSSDPIDDGTSGRNAKVTLRYVLPNDITEGVHTIDFQIDNGWWFGSDWQTQESFTFTVYNPVTSIDIQGDTQVGTGETITLTANVTPDDWNDITWSSNNSYVAQVSGNGKTATVTGRNGGTANITATAGGKTATITITVQQKVTIHFDANGGQGNLPADITTAKSGDEVSMPGGGDLTNGGHAFLGWSTDENASSAGSEHYKVPRYQEGQIYTVPSNATTITFYAVWGTGTQDAEFYIRLDGTIPTEPMGYLASQYSKAIKISGAIKDGGFYFNNTTGIGEHLNATPTDDQIKAVYPSYDPENQYVLWYVIKRESTYHVDGVLLSKNKHNLTYQLNAADVDPTSPFPLGGQYSEGQEVKVGSEQPTRPGYVFLGWSTDAQATEAEYVGGNTFKMPNHDVTLYAIWQGQSREVWARFVDQNGSLIEDLEPCSLGANFRVGSEATATVGENVLVPDGYELVNPEIEEYTITVVSAVDGNYIDIPIKKSTFKVTYDGNGSTSGALPNPNPVEGIAAGTEYQPVDVTNVTLKKEGYALVGWNTDKDATKGLDKVTVNSDITLYAI